MPILFVHVVKAGGTSFAHWLASVAGPKHVVLDYSDRPDDPASEMNTDPAQFLATRQVTVLPCWIRVVRGHFWVKKYERLRGARRITFLRDPVERAVSHYYYWFSTPDQGHTLHRRVVSENMGLLDFARLPEISGCYRERFFRDVDMSSFEFIGDLARLDTEMERLEARLGVRGDRARVNTNPFPDYQERRREVLEGPVRKQLEDILAPEIEFYEAHAGR